ncbi:MAG TPA: VWA domain-containing protein [Candidatus Acidoferrum sp.]
MAQVLALASFVLIPAVFRVTLRAAAQEPNAAQDAGRQATIKTTVRQVLVDVVVTDKKNHPVPGLGQEDFRVLEDGKPQRIVYFEAHRPHVDAVAAKAPVFPDLPANTFTNVVSAANNQSPLNVLLYDLLNTRLTDQPFAHEEIVKFLHHRPAGSRFAIFVLGDTLHLLQGFTDDESQLVAAMNRQGENPHSTLLYQTSSGPSDASGLSAAAGSAQDMMGRMQNMEAASRRFFLTRRVEKTIGAFEEIAKFLSGLPGRKNLIWLSGSFPATIFPATDALDVFGPSANFTADLREASDLLTVGQVAVYPVDIAGLTTDPSFDASQFYRSPGELASAHNNFILEIGAEQATMDQIAEDTGGHAFYNTNGLSDAIATSTEDGANYYTLSYAPSNTGFDGRVRRIHVQLTQAGYHLTYRRSYLADDSVLEADAAGAAAMRLQVALRRGAPLARELPLQAHIKLQGKAKSATKQEIAQLAEFPAFAGRKRWEGIKIQRYSIDYSMEGYQIALEPAENGARARFEILIGAYDAENHTMFGYRSPLERMYLLTKPEEIRKGSFHLRHMVEIPGEAAWLRIAVRDAVGDHLGSLEIPLPLAPDKPNAK